MILLKNEKSIEQIVYNPLKDSKKVPMSFNTSEMFITLYLINENDPFAIFEEKDLPFISKIIKKRLQLHTFKIENDITLLALTNFCDTPGIAILYLWYLQGYCKEHNLLNQTITFKMFTEEIFPDGQLDPSILNEIWDKQKVIKESSLDSDNLVDYYECGKSILYEISMDLVS